MASTPFAIGIDLGTSTSEICVYRHDRPEVLIQPSARSPIMPSLVAMNKRGELIVGEEARAYVDLEGRGVREVKRLMGSGQSVQFGDNTYRPEEISALILRRLKETAEQTLGATVRDVVISVPANFPDAARQATIDAGRLAGLNVVRILNEPTAAALAFGVQNIDLEEQLVVFDFGGGTLDITVLEMVAGVLDVKASFGDVTLGGKDFDAALTALIVRKFQRENPQAVLRSDHLQRLKQPTENAKVALSGASSALVREPFLATEDGAPIDLEIEVTREEFEQAIGPLLDRARACVRQALEAKKVRPEAVDRVLLVGGTTYIPAVRMLVAEMFHREPSTEVNPDLAVSMGASIQAAILSELINQEEGVILTDVSPYSFGIEVVSEVGEQMMLTYSPLIQPNTTIPYSYRRTYSLMSPMQDEVQIKLYQDNTGRAQLPDQAVFTGIEGKIVDIPPSFNGDPHDIEVDFSYDTNGLIKLKATIPRTGQRLVLRYEPTPMRLSEEEAEDALRNVRDLWKSGEKSNQYESVIVKAERLTGSLPEDRRQDLHLAVSDLKIALMGDNSEEIETAGNRLVDVLFELENFREG